MKLIKTYLSSGILVVALATAGLAQANAKDSTGEMLDWLEKTVSVNGNKIPQAQRQIMEQKIAQLKIRQGFQKQQQRKLAAKQNATDADPYEIESNILENQGDFEIEEE